MDLLAKAIMRSHYARQIPISPKIKPPNPTAAALVAIASSATAHVRAESYVRHLPGLAPWREEIRGVCVIAPVPRVASIKEIISVVANELGVTSEQIRGSYRTVKIAFARHVAQYLAQRLTRQSLPIIARFFYRDHTSVLHGVSKIERMIDEDNAVRALVERLEAKIRACGSCA